MLQTCSPNRRHTFLLIDISSWWRLTDAILQHLLTFSFAPAQLLYTVCFTSSELFRIMSSMQSHVRKHDTFIGYPKRAGQCLGGSSHEGDATKNHGNEQFASMFKEFLWRRCHEKHWTGFFFPYHVPSPHNNGQITWTSVLDIAWRRLRQRHGDLISYPTPFSFFCSRNHF